MSHIIVTRSEAITRGLKRYYTNIPCKHGHLAERFVADWSCTACKMLAEKKGRAKKLARQRTAYRANPAPTLERSRRAYQANKDAKRTRYLLRRSAEPELFRKREAGYMRKWQKKNPERLRANCQKRRARRLGAPGSYTPGEIGELLMKQKGRCANCRRNIKHKFHTDHIMPLSRPGATNYISNIQLLCPSCNIRKHAQDPIDFAQKNGRLL